MMYGFPEYVDKKIVDIYKNNVNQFLLDLYSQFKSRKIVIWGTGLYGRAVASLLIDNSFNVVGFCDSFFDESENKSIVLNGKQIQVHGCRFNFEHFQDAVYFISTDYYQDIIELIKKEKITIEYFHDLNTQYIENSIPVEIYTNGAKVPKTFVDGVNKGLFRIILSPDAGSREVYKKIKGKDYFETTWFNIKKYVEETSGNVEVKFILEKGNIDDVDNMINMCLKTGVNKVHLSMDVNISETEFYKYESSFSHFVNRCKNEGINLLSIFTFVPEQIKNKVSNLSTE